MSRIAKNDVVFALQRAQSLLVEAGGDDKRISRAEKDEKLKELKGAERQLVDVFFRFVDHRDAKSGATVTNTDLNKAIDYAKEHMIAKYDLNNNGLSKDEIAKMSLTGQLAVQVAKELKGAGDETAQSRAFAEKYTSFNELVPFDKTPDAPKVEKKLTLTDPAKVPLALKQLLIDATHESTHTDAKTLADCFNAVDKNGNGDGEFIVRYLREQKTGAQLITVDYGAGDNTYGGVFAPNGQLIAGIHDGDLLFK